jgi:hypothetical protein
MDLHEVLASEHLVMNHSEKDLILTLKGGFVTIWKGDGKSREYKPVRVARMPWVGIKAFLLELISVEK